MTILFLDFFGTDQSKMDQTCKFGEQTSRILEFKPFGLEFQNSRCLFTEFASRKKSEKIGKNRKKSKNKTAIFILFKNVTTFYTNIFYHLQPLRSVILQKDPQTETRTDIVAKIVVQIYGFQSESSRYRISLNNVLP